MKKVNKLSTHGVIINEFDNTCAASVYEVYTDFHPDPIYVGCTSNLSQRAKCHVSVKPRRGSVRPLYEAFHSRTSDFEFRQVHAAASMKEARQREKQLIEHHCNKSGGHRLLNRQLTKKK